MTGKLKPKYSGPLSIKFWEQVKTIKPKKLHTAIYMAGCALQDHEDRVLNMLEDAKKGAR